MTVRKTIFVSSLLVIFAAPVWAQNTSTPAIDKRQDNQQKRIDQGVQSGALTPKEAGNLQKREDKIAGDVAKAKADGKVTAKERRKITQEQNVASRKITKKKHNKRVAAR